MWIAAEINADDRIWFLKELIKRRGQNNYMFIPTSRVNDIVEKYTDLSELNRQLLECDWGTWTPKSGESLSQNIDIKTPQYSYRIHLTMNDVGFKTVYMHMRITSVRETHFLYATTSYSTLACHNGNERYVYDNPMYKSDTPDSNWKTTQNSKGI